MMDIEQGAPYEVKAVPGQTGTITMKVVGQKSGEIKGDTPQSWKGAKEHIQISYFQAAVTSPRDPQSGLPTGARQHRGVEVVARNCQGIPRLWNVIFTNENLTSVDISFWSQHASGQAATQAVYYTCKLKNANILSMDHMTSDKDGTLYFRIRFTYQTIEYTWVNGGITAEDNWEKAL
jgi:type VI secretion system secreted protein Hcp